MSAADRAVGLFRRDGQLTAAADLHAGDPVLPALDQAAQRELDRFAAVPRAVELFAGVVLDADVVHLDGAAGHGLGAIADHQILDDKLVRRRPVRKLDLWLGSHRNHRSLEPCRRTKTFSLRSTSWSPRRTISAPSCSTMRSTNPKSTSACAPLK